MGIYIGQRRPDPRALAASRMHPQTLADLLTNPYGYPLPGDPPPAGGQRRTPQVGSNVIPPYQPVPQPQPPVPPQPPQRPADPWQGMRDVGGFRGNDVLGGGEDPLAAAAPAAPQAPQAPQRPAGLLGKLTTPDETIMGLAAGLLDAGRWSTTPINMSEALGAGVKGAMAGKQLKQERKEREDILAFKKRAEDFEQRRIAQWQKIVEGMKDVTPEQRALLSQVGPEQGANIMLAKSMRSEPAANQSLVNIQMPDKTVRTFRQGDPAVDAAIKAGGREIGIGADGGTDRTRYSTQPGILDLGNGKKVPIQYGDDGSINIPDLPEGAKVLDPYEKARDTATGKAEGEAIGKVRGNLGKVLQTADTSIKLIDAMLTHPGRETATGLSSVIDPRNYIAGTDAANFNVRRGQMEGRVFLDAFDSLRGGGQITETEGEKATKAMARLDAAQSDAEFFAALEELKGLLELGKQRAIDQASGAGGAPTNAPPAAGRVPVYNPQTGEFDG